MVLIAANAAGGDAAFLNRVLSKLTGSEKPIMGTAGDALNTLNLLQSWDTQRRGLRSRFHRYASHRPGHADFSITARLSLRRKTPQNNLF